MAFANFLIDFLPNTELTNEQIADHMGYVRPNIVSMWKSGRTKVTLDAVYGLSKLLHVDLGYLLALYFEQYTADAGSGAVHFAEITQMMSRICTAEEWEIIKTAREARKHNSLPLTGAQRSTIKKLLAVPPTTAEGPLKQVELNFASAGDRRKFSRRGHDRDMSIEEIEEAQARKAAARSVGGETLTRSGKRPPRT